MKSTTTNPYIRYFNVESEDELASCFNVINKELAEMDTSEYLTKEDIKALHMNNIQLNR